MANRNRTISDSGVRLDGNLLGIDPITGTGISEPEALAVAQPLIDFIGMFPYEIDEHGKIAYRTNTLAISHTPILKYGVDHPKAGQVIAAGYSDGAYATRFGNAPMPFIDFDMIPPHTMETLLRTLIEIAEIQASAT